MCNQNLDATLKEKCLKLMKIVDEKNKQIEQLKRSINTAETEENETFYYLKLFQQFLIDVKVQKLYVERKYDTVISRNFIDVGFSDFAKYFTNYFDKKELRKFREFLKDMQFVESKPGGYFAGAGKERQKVVRIRAEVYKRLVNDLG